MKYHKGAIKEVKITSTKNIFKLKVVFTQSLPPTSYLELLQGSLLGRVEPSHWSRNVETRLSLVESFPVMLT